MNHQSGILDPIADHAVFMEFDAVDLLSAADLLDGLASRFAGTGHVLGIGRPLADGLGAAVPGLDPFPDYSQGGLSIPSTQHALLLILRGDDPAALDESASALGTTLSSCFSLAEKTGGFKYEGGRDLTGYEDGTENPTGEEAADAALVRGQGGHVDGSSFVAIQRWRHDFDAFNSMNRTEQDESIGRYRDTNEEFDAPDSAHVKRTAQEDFDPDAFVLRRSMPWSDERGCGLFFVAYGCSFRAFDVQMRRMTGSEDGIVDGLFRFSIPVSGGFYWCPPVHDGRPVLSLLRR